MKPLRAIKIPGVIRISSQWDFPKVSLKLLRYAYKGIILPGAMMNAFPVRK
jgi:hypothetical protein